MSPLDKYGFDGIVDIQMHSMPLFCGKAFVSNMQYLFLFFVIAASSIITVGGCC